MTISTTLSLLFGFAMVALISLSIAEVCMGVAICVCIVLYCIVVSTIGDHADHIS